MLLVVNRLTDRNDMGASLMSRVRGTDVWHLSYSMRPDWRASYGFVVRRGDEVWPWERDDAARLGPFDAAVPDPLNPEVVLDRAGRELSMVALADAPSSQWLGQRGRVMPQPEVVVAPGGRRVWLHRAEGFVTGGPVVVMFDGGAWLRDAPLVVENLVADGLIRPPLLALVDTGSGGERWEELGEHGAAAGWVVDELLPWLRAEHGVGDRAGDVVVAGQSLGGYTALRIALERPGAVGGVLAQSSSLWVSELGEVLPGVPGMPGVLAGVRIWLEVGLQEWVLLEAHRELAARLAGAGAAVRVEEFNGGHDHACWRVGFAHGLRHQLPPG